jgi:hypothetical protein
MPIIGAFDDESPADRVLRGSPRAIGGDVVAAIEASGLRPSGTGWQPPFTAANRRSTP